MKKIKMIITGILIMFLSLGIFAQDNNPPDPPGEHGSEDDQPGGNAPLSGGTIMLFTLGALYGGKRIYDINK